MKKLYSTMIATLAVFAVSGNALAQAHDGAGHGRSERPGEHRGPGRGFGEPAMMIERMAEHLELDEIQRQSITNIVEASKPEFAALRDAARDNREAIKALDVGDPAYGSELQNLSVRSGELAAELTLLTGRLRGEIAAILSDEQRQLLEERMSRSGEKRRHPGRDRAR